MTRFATENVHCRCTNANQDKPETVIQLTSGLLLKIHEFQSIVGRTINFTLGTPESDSEIADFDVVRRHGKRFEIYHRMVEEPYRRRGYGTAMMFIIEGYVRNISNEGLIYTSTNQQDFLQLLRNLSYAESDRNQYGFQTMTKTFS